MIEAISKLLPSGNITLTFEAFEGGQIRVLVRQIANKADKVSPTVHLPPFTVTSAPAMVMAEVETALAELSNFIAMDINATLERVKADLAEQAKAAAEAAEAAKKKSAKPAVSRPAVTVKPTTPATTPSVNFDDGNDTDGEDNDIDGEDSDVENKADTAPAATPAPSLFD
jgi:hypothetical protein